MAIHPDDSVRKPKGPVTITGVDTGTQIVVSDYLGAGRAARFIKSNDSSATNFLGVRINSLTINYKENDGLVGTPVKIWATSGAEFLIAGGSIIPEGIAITSFEVVSNDNTSPISITIW